MSRPTTRMQDAVRILMLIDQAAEPVTPPEGDEALACAVEVIRTQVRLQRLDFWVRDPDYLANKLLNDYENADRDPALLAMVGELFNSESPNRALPDAAVFVWRIRGAG